METETEERWSSFEKMFFAIIILGILFMGGVYFLGY